MGAALPAAAFHRGIPSVGFHPATALLHPVLSCQRIACATPKLDGPARVVACNHAPGSRT